MRLEESLQYTRQLINHLREIDLPTCAASVSYYAMLASIPLVALLVTLSAQLLPQVRLNGEGAAADAGTGVRELEVTLARVLPAEALEVVTSEIARIQANPPVGLLSLGLVVSLWTASNAFMAIMRAMNRIYGVDETRPLWMVRFRAILLPTVLAIILIIALACIIVLPSLIHFLGLHPVAWLLLLLGQWLALFLVVLLSFGLTYRLAPNRFARERLVSPGSAAGASLFLVSSWLFQIYVANFGAYEVVYGSLGGAIIFLLWLWLISASLLIGCAINKTLEDRSP